MAGINCLHCLRQHCHPCCSSCHVFCHSVSFYQVVRFFLFLSLNEVDEGINFYAGVLVLL